MSKINHRIEEKTTPSFRVSRRNFLKAAGAGTAVAGAATFGSITYSQSRAAAQGEWDQEADVVVVGSGAAALAAAATSISLGDSVVVIEKAGIVGGTSVKSGGVYWVPNNPVMREQGYEDPREDALKYMVKYSYSQYYNPEAERYGAFPNDFALIEAMYDRGSEAIERLAELDALHSQGLNMWTGEPGSDYMEH